MSVINDVAACSSVFLISYHFDDGCLGNAEWSCDATFLSLFSVRTGDEDNDEKCNVCSVCEHHQLERTENSYECVSVKAVSCSRVRYHVRAATLPSFQSVPACPPSCLQHFFPCLWPSVSRTTSSRKLIIMWTFNVIKEPHRFLFSLLGWSKEGRAQNNH